MIHPSHLSNHVEKSSQASTEELLSFWETRSIFVRRNDYLYKVMGAMYFIGIFLPSSPINFYYQGSLITAAVLLFATELINRKRLRKAYNDLSPIEKIKLQRERMLASKHHANIMIILGMLITIVLFMCSHYLFPSKESDVEIAISLGVIIVIGLVALIFNKQAYKNPIADAERVLKFTVDNKSRK